MTFNPAGGKTYFLGSSISSTATTILLSSFIEPVSDTPYTMVLLNTDIAFGTIAPGTSSSEFISFTGITQNANGTATLTGVTRGLNKKYPFTTDVTFKLPHSGQSIFILSDAPQVFAQYPAKQNDETITGLWTFNQFPITPSNVPATTSTLGLVKVSVAPASALSPIAVETTDPRVPVAYAVDSVGTDAYAITPSPAITSYSAGQRFTFKAGTANTGAATLNVNGLGAVAITKFATAALTTGDILVNQVVTVVYDGTNMQLISPANNYPVVITYDLAGSPFTWTKQLGLQFIDIECWGGGGSAGATTSGASGGGGGGAYTIRRVMVGSLGATETVTIGAGGAASTGTNNGSVGGNTTFSSLLTAYGGGGGGGGATGSGGGGGGSTSVGATAATTTAAAGGGPAGGAAAVTGVGGSSSYGGGGGGDNTGAGGSTAYGGGGGASIASGGASLYGGGGGGSDASGIGGTSLYGGAGGNGNGTGAGNVGSVPGGGGGGGGGGSGTGGAGGAGRCRVTEYYG